MTYQVQSLENELNLRSPPSLFYHVCTQMNKPKQERNVVVTTSKQAWGGTWLSKYFYANDHDHFVTPNDKVFILIDFLWFYLFFSHLFPLNNSHARIFSSLDQLLKNNGLSILLSIRLLISCLMIYVLDASKEPTRTLWARYWNFKF
jgi:hypothetical protein